MITTEQDEPLDTIRVNRERKVIILDALRGDEHVLALAVSDFISKNKPLFIHTWVGGITVYTMIVFEE